MVGRKVAEGPEVSERSERRRPVSETPLRPRRRGARWDRPAPPHTSGGPRHTGHRPDGLPRGSRRYVGDQDADVGTPSPPAEPPGQGLCLLNCRVAGHRRAGVDCVSECGGSQTTAARVAGTTDIRTGLWPDRSCEARLSWTLSRGVDPPPPAIAHSYGEWPSGPAPPLPPEAEPALPASWDQ